MSQPSNQLADTAYLAAPDTGETAQGVSCVAAQHDPEPLEEVCTPWQYVRPSATAMRAAAGRADRHPTERAAGGSGRRWKVRRVAANPCPDSLWIEVNRAAVPECTGPNRKPTVAQFCAFAVLPDGRRVKTSNSINNPYCEELFVEWIRERYS